MKAMRIADYICFGFRIKLYTDTNSAKGNVEMQTVYVPAGQRTQVTLADGTMVWVNGKRADFPVSSLPVT